MIRNKFVVAAAAVGSALAMSGCAMGAIAVRVALLSGPPGDLITFAVADNGAGVAPDQLTRLFEPLAHADIFGATGPRLSVMRRMAELLGGDITAESVLGHGSKFTLTIAAHFAGRQ